MACDIEGAEATAVANGSYNSTSYEIVMTMTVAFGANSMEMQTSVRGERIGDC